MNDLTIALIIILSILFILFILIWKINMQKPNHPEVDDENYFDKLEEVHKSDYRPSFILLVSFTIVLIISIALSITLIAKSA